MSNGEQQRTKNTWATIDNKLKCKSHIQGLCKKASQKLGELSRPSNCLNDSEKKLYFKAIVKSQFNLCSLGWLFCSRRSNDIINKVHERALRVVIDEQTSDFKKLLQRKNDVCNHHRNIQALSIETFKTKDGLAPAIVGSMFTRRYTIYNFRNFQEFGAERKRTVYFGLETLSYRSP